MILVTLFHINVLTDDLTLKFATALTILLTYVVQLLIVLVRRRDA
jgi:hypothetical protein